jgi:hypothetical protein
MNSIQPADYRSTYSAPTGKAMSPVHPPQRVVRVDRELERTPTRVVQQPGARIRLHSQQPQSNQGLPQRNRVAIDAYRQLAASSEREMLSSLLGVDEYA